MTFRSIARKQSIASLARHFTGQLLWWIAFCSSMLAQSSRRTVDQVRVHQLLVPGYPHLARAASLQGTAGVTIEIGSDGKVISAEASGASPLLLRETEANIREWTFGPFPEGVRFPVRHKVIYVYKLEGKQAYYDPLPKVVLSLPDRVEIKSQPPEPQP
jgi:hypothetical protein